MGKDIRGLEPLAVNARAFTYYPRLTRVKTYVENHLAEPLNLETLAEVAGLEKTYFSRFFHEKTGVRYHEWVNSVRIDRAIELMRGKDLAITELAYEVGFQDMRTFQRAFERRTGLTPHAMKKTLRP